jgi:hypothetical protein
MKVKTLCILLHFWLPTKLNLETGGFSIKLNLYFKKKLVCNKPQKTRFQPKIQLIFF